MTYKIMLGKMTLFLNKFNACICGTRSLDTLSAELLWFMVSAYPKLRLIQLIALQDTQHQISG